MVGFVHFSNFLILSEKYYKLQSCWITLYNFLRIWFCHGFQVGFGLGYGPILTLVWRLALVQRGFPFALSVFLG